MWVNLTADHYAKLEVKMTVIKFPSRAVEEPFASPLGKLFGWSTEDATLAV
jgi:hypothetical protein